MAETQWAEEEPPPKKKSIPTWVWFCGGGCLLALVVIVAVIAMGVGYVKKATDEEVQWPRVAEVLPYDERPKELHLRFGNHIGVEQYTFEDDRGFIAQLSRMKGGQGKKVRTDLFEADPPVLQGNVGMMKFEDVVHAPVEVQGRTLSTVRMRIVPGGLLKKLEGSDQAFGQATFVDLTPEGGEGCTWLQLTRHSGGDQPISDEEIQTFLAPFHVGPDR